MWDLNKIMVKGVNSKICNQNGGLCWLIVLAHFWLNLMYRMGVVGFGKASRWWEGDYDLGDLMIIPTHWRVMLQLCLKGRSWTLVIDFGANRISPSIGVGPRDVVWPMNELRYQLCFVLCLSSLFLSVITFLCFVHLSI